MAPPSLTRSQSLPGICGLGTSSTLKRGNHRKHTSLAWKFDSPVDLSMATAASEKAINLAKKIQDPLWRFQKKPAAALPTGPEPADLPANVRIPRVAPAWLKHEKQVLRFHGYFQECVGERSEENARFRHCVLMYYLEDGSIQIFEPKVENSGISQGQFLKRHRVLRTDGMGFVGPGDFRLGTDMEIYKKTFRITSCDRFTRWFYEQNGVDVGSEEAVPVSKFDMDYSFKRAADKGEFPAPRLVRESQQLNEKYLGGGCNNDKLEQFLENDLKVLRFYGYWDDPTNYGIRIYFVIHYFLADNSVEINEAHVRNSGRDPFPVFYKKGPLPKVPYVNCCPGILSPDPEVYLPADFIVGESIHVWGRKVVLYDCDDFTRNFYREYMSVEQGKEDVTPPPPKHAALHYPPPTGFGSDQDSLGSVLSIVPKPAKKDLIKLMTLTGEVLRFEGNMINGQPEDEDRRFVFGIFPADDTVGVWEMQVRNSGFIGGKFSERGEKINPDTGKPFVLEDFYVGAVVTFVSQPFLVTRADEHTLLFMEARPQQYPLANPAAIAEKLRCLADHPDIAQAEAITPDRLSELARNEAGIEFVDHEVITLLRAAGTPAPEGEVPTIKTASLLELMGSGGLS